MSYMRCSYYYKSICDILWAAGNTDDMQRQKNKTHERITQRDKGVYVYS